jgi:nucleotide-binding universal stress UspA family protein
MGPFQHLLVPIDFGDAMQTAIDLALALAKGGEAQITLMHAFDLTGFLAATSAAPPIDIEPILSHLKQELARVVESARARHAQVDSVFCTGNTTDAILEIARSRACDVIVIGTHGRRGLAHALLGSVAEKIVRLAPVPVLTVRPARTPAA